MFLGILRLLRVLKCFVGSKFNIDCGWLVRYLLLKEFILIVFCNRDIILYLKCVKLVSFLVLFESEFIFLRVGFFNVDV